MKNSLLTTRYLLLTHRAQAALSLVLLISGVVILSGLSLIFLVNSFTSTTLAFRAANHALAVASAGMDDALLRLVRNKNFDTGGSAYSVNIGPNETAIVEVEQDNPVTGQIKILSEAQILLYRRKIQAVVAVDPVTQRVNVISRGQVAL